MIPMIASVDAAFLAWGRLNAGTPFEIASTPVSAVAPCEKALRIAKSPTAAAVVAAAGSSSELTPTGGQPPRQRVIPTPTRTRIDATNPYVGIANSVPDSRAPRRFAKVTSATKKIDNATRCSFAHANAEPIANTPATTETTTVIM
jgi:hypothetical protein